MGIKRLSLLIMGSVIILVIANYFNYKLFYRQQLEKQQTKLMAANQVSSMAVRQYLALADIMIYDAAQKMSSCTFHDVDKAACLSETMETLCTNLLAIKGCRVVLPGKKTLKYSPGKINEYMGIYQDSTTGQVKSMHYYPDSLILQYWVNFRDGNDRNYKLVVDIYIPKIISEKVKPLKQQNISTWLADQEGHIVYADVRQQHVGLIDFARIKDSLAASGKGILLHRVLARGHPQFMLTSYSYLDIFGEKLVLLSSQKSDTITHALSTGIFRNFALSFIVILIILTSFIWFTINLTRKENRLKSVNNEMQEVNLQLKQEIAGRQGVEDKLTTEKALLHSLINSVPDLIFYKDLEGHYIGCNDSFATFIGMNKDKIIGKTDSDLYPARKAERFKKSDQELLSSRQSLSFEMWESYPDGKRVYLNTLKTCFTDKTGNVLGFIGISRDITQTHEDQMALSLAKEQADAANIAKGQFLATMSHEIRTPMNGIIGMANILKKSGLKPEQQENLEVIIESGNTLLAIINDILDFSKIDSGMLELEFVPFNIHNEIESVLRLLMFKTESKKIDLRLNISKEVPEYLKGDPVRVKQILINLVNNAIKFTEKGFVRIHIEKMAEMGDKVKLHFKVSDSGVGMKAGIKDKLFMPFTQSDSSTTRKFGGTGLGLAIAKNLVELMDGKIDVESTEGKGTEFWYTLTLGLVTQEEMATQVEHAVVNDNNNSKNKEHMKILLAEDNLVNQRVAVSLLKMRGHEVDVASNGKIAVEKFNTGQYDVILMDLSMPEMDGVEATTVIRAIEKQEERTKGIPIIAVTANVLKEDQDKCFAAGMNGFLSKPFQPEKLKEVLEKTCQGRTVC